MTTLVPSGSIPQIEALLGYPPWFRDGTRLGPSGSAFPERIPLADDLRIMSNICERRAEPALLAAIITAPRAPLSRGWGGAFAVAPTLGDALDLIVGQLPESNPYVRVQTDRAFGEVSLGLEIAEFVPPIAHALVGMGALFLVCRQMKPYGPGAMRACVLEIAAPASPDLLALQALMETPLRFGAPAYRLRFPEAWLARPNPDADAELWRLQVNRLAGQRHRQSPLANAVADAVRAALEAGERPPMLADMAMRFGL